MLSKEQDKDSLTSICKIEKPVEILPLSKAITLEEYEQELDLKREKEELEIREKELREAEEKAAGNYD